MPFSSYQGTMGSECGYQSHDYFAYLRIFFKKKHDFTVLLGSYKQIVHRNGSVNLSRMEIVLEAVGGNQNCMDGIFGLSEVYECSIAFAQVVSIFLRQSVL